MLDKQTMEIEQFLDQMHLIETKVADLIASSDLTEREKRFILDHILIVPSRSCMKAEMSLEF